MFGPKFYHRECVPCRKYIDTTWLSDLWKFDRDHADCKKEKA